MTSKNFLKENRLVVGALAVYLILFLATVVIRIGHYEQGIIYRNIDASYHTINTVEALSVNSVKSTLLLPTVTYGEPLDKNVPWGATVPDKNGNQIYTSFPQGGFLMAYLFFC
jgi:hypothetical protein